MSNNPQQVLHPGFFRRLAAMTYDLFLLMGVLFVSFLPAPLIPESFQQSTLGNILMQAYFVLVLFLFFGWFWTHGGQTLGMRAWRIKLIAEKSTTISWTLAAKRFGLATLSLALGGLGYLWAIFHRENMTLHDLYSGSQMVMLKKTK